MSIEILEYLSHLHPSIQGHVTVKVPNPIVPYALHISKDDNLPTMIPRIGDRQSKNEDRTIPRICVCDTLIDCINGYQALIDDYIKYHPLATVNNENSDTTVFNGGWYIYQIPFEYGIIPDETLVYDQPLTKEYWLVSYQDKNEYHPEKVGQFFIRDYNRRYCDQLGVKHALELFIEIDKDMFLFKDTLLTKGVYHVQYVYYNKDNLPSCITDITVSYKKIEQNQYDYIKDHTVSLLNHHDKPFIHW